MTKYIDKSALVAEIERRIKERDIQMKQGCWVSSTYMYEDLLDFIDTLEVKEVDLEKELDKYYGVYIDKNGLTYDIIDKERCFDWKEDNIMANQAKVAKLFFELGLKTKGE